MVFALNDLYLEKEHKFSRALLMPTQGYTASQQCICGHYLLLEKWIQRGGIVASYFIKNSIKDLPKMAASANYLWECKYLAFRSIPIFVFWGYNNVQMLMLIVKSDFIKIFVTIFSANSHLWLFFFKLNDATKNHHL